MRYGEVSAILLVSAAFLNRKFQIRTSDPQTAQHSTGVALDWETTAERYYQQLYTFCFRMLGNSSDAEDAVQETFLRAFRKESTLLTEAMLPAWLYTIARNICIDKMRWWKRWKKRLSATFSFSDLQEAGLLGWEASVGDNLAFLSSPIQALPLRQREVFLLRDLHDFSTAETAQMLKISEGTVKSTLAAARSTLKEKIEKREKNNPSDSDVGT